MKFLKVSLIFTLLIASFGASSTPLVMEGPWRATLHRDTERLPFLFDLSKNTDGSTFRVVVYNGDEHLLMDEAYLDGDSLHIPFKLFDAEIVAQMSGKKLSGKFYRKSQKVVVASLPFEADFGLEYKFFPEGKAVSTKNITGKWATAFINMATGDSTAAVGNFVQNGTNVSGSFLTSTGDYRFLTGNINGDSLFMSNFDGSNAMLFKAVLETDGVLKGALWSGFGTYKTWTAKLDPNAQLPDATKLTFLKPGYEKVSFKFPDLNGNMISLDDERFKNKVVILQIMGSWCPNCMDETNFLEPWFEKNKSRGVEIVGLSFERSGDAKIAIPKIAHMVKRLSIPYPVLFAGATAGSGEALPMLNKVMSYPTTIFIDRKGLVREIHTGFSGPGTGDYYQEFIQDFNVLVDKLIAQ